MHAHVRVSPASKLAQFFSRPVIRSMSSSLGLARSICMASSQGGPQLNNAHNKYKNQKPCAPGFEGSNFEFILFLFVCCAAVFFDWGDNRG